MLLDLILLILGKKGDFLFYFILLYFILILLNKPDFIGLQKCAIFKSQTIDRERNNNSWAFTV